MQRKVDFYFFKVHFLINNLIYKVYVNKIH